MQAHVLTNLMMHEPPQGLEVLKKSWVRSMMRSIYSFWELLRLENMSPGERVRRSSRQVDSAMSRILPEFPTAGLQSIGMAPGFNLNHASLSTSASHPNL